MPGRPRQPRARASSITRDCDASIPLIQRAGTSTFFRSHTYAWRDHDIAKRPDGVVDDQIGDIADLPHHLH